jgi:hypothetical protein
MVGSDTSGMQLKSQMRLTTVTSYNDNGNYTEVASFLWLNSSLPDVKESVTSVAM